MYNAIDIWPILAGLGLFLFGMHILEEAIKKAGGRSFKLFLRTHAKNRVRGVLSGAFITSILQSSSMVILLVMSFTGAGIFTLQQGISVLLGVNIGTTITGWLVTLVGFKLDIGTIILPFIAVGGLGIIFLKNEKLSQISKLIMGFSLMFLGLAYMKDGFAVLSEVFDDELLKDKNVFLYVLIGAGLAAAIQSSSAAAMIFLTSLSSGIIQLDDAVFLMIGADLGTTVTAILGTLGGNTVKKKVGWSHFIFNVFNTTLSMILAGTYLLIIRSGFGITDALIGLVTFHTLSKFTGIAVVLPFLKYFVMLVNKMVPSKEKTFASYLAQTNPLESVSACEALKKESIAFYKRVLSVNAAYFGEGRGGTNPSLQYSRLKEYENEIIRFYFNFQKAELDTQEAEITSVINESVRNASFAAKEIKNIKHNLDELSEAVDVKFYEVYEQIKKRQLLFYKELDNIADDIRLLSGDDMENIDQIEE